MTRRKLFLVLPLLAVVSALWFVGCARVTDPWQDEAGPPRVVVTIAPLYSFVKAVGEKRVGVKWVCQNKGPHDFEFDIADTQVLNRANRFFSIGLGLDPFADKMEKISHNPELRSVKLGARLPEKLLLEGKHDHDEKDEKHEKEHAHHHGEHDPHIWLGIDQAKEIVKVIRDELSRVDEAGAKDYERNTEAYLKELEKLREDGRKMLAKKTNRRIISFHESLGYFARSFDVEIVDSIERAPGDEPTGVHMAKLVKLCSDKKNPVAAIAIEPQYPKTTSARTLQNTLKDRGIKIPLIEIDPLETADPQQLKKKGAGWYLDQMRANLKALADNLP
jgi:ABC-type Zn uptake system ZnuABC Zn-binding protein ZnuA